MSHSYLCPPPTNGRKGLAPLDVPGNALIIIPSMNPRNLSHTHPRFPRSNSERERSPASIHPWSHGDWRLIFPHLVSSPAPPPLPQRPQALPPPSASARPSKWTAFCFCRKEKASIFSLGEEQKKYRRYPTSNNGSGRSDGR